jgi:hypothetical protein
MNVRPKLAPEQQMTIEEFLAFTETRPEEERWELIEGVARSNTKADQAWRRKVYASVPNCQHYVTVSLRAVEVHVYNRSDGWKQSAHTNLADALALPALGVSIPLADIYRWIPLGGGIGSSIP